MRSQAPADVYNSRDFSFKMVQCNSKQHQLRRRDPASRSTIKMVASAISTAFTKGVCKIVAPKASPNWLLAKVQTQIVVRKLKDLARSRVGLPAKNKDNAQLYKSVQPNGYEQEMRFQTNCDSSTHMSHGPKGPEDASIF